MLPFYRVVDQTQVKRLLDLAIVVVQRRVKKLITRRQEASGMGHLQRDERERLSEIVTIGLDLAKNLFQVHGADRQGNAGLRKKLGRAQMLGVLRQVAAPPSRDEVWGGAHFPGGGSWQSRAMISASSPLNM
ncbi:hypothetical protein CCR90_03690 [Rhodovulum sulfidophilum]|nr:hypothetical protein [Rhodovulum sulfidophilum]